MALCLAEKLLLYRKTTKIPQVRKPKSTDTYTSLTNFTYTKLASWPSRKISGRDYAYLFDDTVQKRGAYLLMLLRSLLTIHSLLTIRPLPSAFCRLPYIIARSAALKVEAPAEIHKRRIRYRRNEAISFRILHFGHLLAPVVTWVQVNLFRISCLSFTLYLPPVIRHLICNSQLEIPKSGIEHPASSIGVLSPWPAE